MTFEEKIKFVDYNVIQDLFDYRFLEQDFVDKYNLFNEKFELLLKKKSEIFGINDCIFHIKNDVRCNAFARKVKGYSIIGITHGYAINMSEIFDEKYFEKVIAIGLLNEVTTSDSYCELNEIAEFSFNEFMLECAIQFTFEHEFQHLLQLNSTATSIDYCFNENLEKSPFDLKKHAWEFDADRFASFGLLKFIFQKKRELKIKSDNIFKCMLYLGLGSIFISKLLFYFGVSGFNKSVKRQDFYLKKYSHPHLLVRVFNVLDYYYDNLIDSFPEINFNQQELLNNTLGILNIYLKSFIPNQTIMSDLFLDLDKHLNDINSYNAELYETAIKDLEIRELLIKRRINFDNN